MYDDAEWPIGSQVPVWMRHFEWSCKHLWTAGRCSICGVRFPWAAGWRETIARFYARARVRGDGATIASVTSTKPPSRLAGLADLSTEPETSTT